jgi:hypothetical protein
MEILRLPETTSIFIDLVMPSASSQYVMQYEDLSTGESFSASATSNSSKTARFILNSKYLTYAVNLFSNVYDPSNNLVLSTGIDVVKPYCDVTTVKTKLGITTAQAVEAEKVARRIIEAEVGSFQFVRKLKEVIGMGIDYLPIDERIVNIYEMSENNEVIFVQGDDSYDQYKISVDKSSIVLDDEIQNKVEYTKVWRDRNYAVTFCPGCDYLIDGSFGYQVIPSDVQEACEILMQDLVQGNTRYFSRNIIEFDNQEFKIKFAPGSSAGTGNLIVDKLLIKYKNRIRPGVI